MSSPPSIQIHAFRGSRDSEDEDPRLGRTGHVGISVDGGETIWGFNPVKPAGISRDELIIRLRAGEYFPAWIRKDTELFKRAEKSRPVAIEEQTFMDANICQEVEKLLTSDIKNSTNSPLRDKRYSFPRKRLGGFETNCWNCCTYPSTLGMETPFPSGQLGEYLEKDEYLLIRYLCR